jgi:hypothetical protein
MAITTSGTTLTFNDATTQTTAPVNTSANVTSATAVAGTGISVTAVTTTGAATHTVTNTGVTSVTAGTGISVSASTGGVTITNTQTPSTGTVTSVATGNGLSGGTITTSGTLTVACPTTGSVGSYAFLCGSPGAMNPGSTYSGLLYGGFWGNCGALSYTASGSTSGSWRCMGYAVQNGQQGTLFCRIS